MIFCIIVSVLTILSYILFSLLWFWIVLVHSRSAMEFLVVTAKDKSTTSSRYKKESRKAHDEREKKRLHWQDDGERWKTWCLTCSGKCSTIVSPSITNTVVFSCQRKVVSLAEQCKVSWKDCYWMLSCIHGVRFPWFVHIEMTYGVRTGRNGTLNCLIFHLPNKVSYAAFYINSLARCSTTESIETQLRGSHLVPSSL